MFKVILLLDNYAGCPELMASLIAGAVMALILFNFLIIPLHNRIKYALIMKFGDDTAMDEGIVNMSFRDNFHIVGLVSSLLLNIGFASPVYYDDENFKRPKLYTFLISLSGLLVYLAFFVVIYFVYASLSLNDVFSVSSMQREYVDTSFWGYAYFACYSTTYFLSITCIYSFIFNLIPVYPMDMGDTLYLCAPVNWQDALRNNELIITLGLFALSFLTIGSPSGLIPNMSVNIMTKYKSIIASLWGIAY